MVQKKIMIIISLHHLERSSSTSWSLLSLLLCPYNHYNHRIKLFLPYLFADQVHRANGEERVINKSCHVIRTKHYLSLCCFFGATLQANVLSVGPIHTQSHWVCEDLSPLVACISWDVPQHLIQFSNPICSQILSLFKRSLLFEFPQKIWSKNISWIWHHSRAGQINSDGCCHDSRLSVKEGGASHHRKHEYITSQTCQRLKFCKWPADRSAGVCTQQRKFDTFS